MMELVFTVCLLSHPAICEERALQYMNLPSPMACVMGAQPQLAAWSASHPKWRIARWSCQTLDTREAKA